VITSQDSYGQGGLSAFLSVADAYGIRVLVSVSVGTSDADATDNISKLRALNNVQAKVIICLAQDQVAAQIIYAASKQNLIGSQNVWVLSEALYNYVLYNDDPFYQEAFGMLHGGFVVNIGTKETNLTDHFYEQWTANGFSDDDIDIYALSAYDSILSLALALEVAFTNDIDPTNGSLFLPMFQKVKGEGVNGNLGFTKTNDPIESHYSLVNIISPAYLSYPGNYTTNTVGLIEVKLNSSSIIVLNQSAIVWGTRDNTRPADHPPHKGLHAWQWVLIAIGIALLLGLIGLIIFIVFSKQFHVIFIPRNMENDEWGQ